MANTIRRYRGGSSCVLAHTKAVIESDQALADYPVNASDSVGVCLRLHLSRPFGIKGPTCSPAYMRCDAWLRVEVAAEHSPRQSRPTPGQ